MIKIVGFPDKKAASDKESKEAAFKPKCTRN
jgi:hypothetical protein